MTDTKPDLRLSFGGNKLMISLLQTTPPDPNLRYPPDVVLFFIETVVGPYLPAEYASSDLFPLIAQALDDFKEKSFFYFIIPQIFGYKLILADMNNIFEFWMYGLNGLDIAREDLELLKAGDDYTPNRALKHEKWADPPLPVSVIPSSPEETP